MFTLLIAQAAFVGWDIKRGQMTIHRWSPANGYTVASHPYQVKRRARSGPPDLALTTAASASGNKANVPAAAVAVHQSTSQLSWRSRVAVSEQIHSSAMIPSAMR